MFSDRCPISMKLSSVKASDIKSFPIWWHALDVQWQAKVRVLGFFQSFFLNLRTLGTLKVMKGS
jgi:hypothetical protein